MKLFTLQPSWPPPGSSSIQLSQGFALLVLRAWNVLPPVWIAPSFYSLRSLFKVIASESSSPIILFKTVPSLVIPYSHVFLQSLAYHVTLNRCSLSLPPVRVRASPAFINVIRSHVKSVSVSLETGVSASFLPFIALWPGETAVHSFSKYLFSIHHVSGPFLSTGDTSLSKIDTDPVLSGLLLWWWEWTDSEHNK